MPIYEYECRKCGKDFEELAKSMSACGEAMACPECGSTKTSRKLSVFAVKSEGGSAAASGAGHVHSGGCGCGRAPGSCPMMG